MKVWIVIQEIDHETPFPNVYFDPVAALDRFSELCRVHEIGTEPGSELDEVMDADRWLMSDCQGKTVTCWIGDAPMTKDYMMSLLHAEGIHPLPSVAGDAHQPSSRLSELAEAASKLILKDECLRLASAARQLEQEHGSFNEVPDCPKADWEQSVARGTCLDGYYEWCVKQRTEF